MRALDQEFVVGETMKVTAGMAFRDFPSFPRSGILVLLQPPCAVAERELTGRSAQFSLPGGPLVLHYSYWHVNEHQVIGLLCTGEGAAAISLGTRVRFVKRERRPKSR